MTDERTTFTWGGLETCVGRQAGGRRFCNRIVNHDIVPDRRLIFAYSIACAAKPVSAAIATELEPQADDTRPVFTEHGVFATEANDPDSRALGWRWLLDRLADEIHALAWRAMKGRDSELRTHHRGS